MRLKYLHGCTPAPSSLHFLKSSCQSHFYILSNNPNLLLSFNWRIKSTCSLPNIRFNLLTLNVFLWCFYRITSFWHGPYRNWKTKRKLFFPNTFCDSGSLQWDWGCHAHSDELPLKIQPWICFHGRKRKKMWRKKVWDSLTLRFKLLVKYLIKTILWMRSNYLIKYIKNYIMITAKTFDKIFDNKTILWLRSNYLIK